MTKQDIYENCFTDPVYIDYNYVNRDELLKMVDEYAKQVAKDFARWAVDNFQNAKAFSMNELYDEYLKTCV